MTWNAPTDWNAEVRTDFINMMIGDKLGWGIGRIVYAFKYDPTLVVKVEYDTGRFQNALEWKLWKEFDGAMNARWLAPCHSISPCGSILLQSRTYPVQPEYLPKRVPKFLSDLKSENWGRLNKRVVCHDYGLNLIMSKAAYDARTQRADWRS